MKPRGWIPRVVFVVVLAAIGTGCAARATVPSYAADAVAPGTNLEPRSGGSPLPASATAGNREARADHLLGSIAASVGVIQHLTDAAAAQRDVVAFNCENDKLSQAFGIESSARSKRSAVRESALEDADDGGAYAAIEALEQRARALRDEAGQCVGEDSLVSYVGERMVTTIDPGVPLKNLEARADAVKGQTFRTKARVALLDDTILMGGVRNVYAAPQGATTTAGPNVATPKPAVPPPPPAAGGTTGAATTGDAHDASMLIRTAEIALAVYEVDKNLDGVEKKAIALGGYLALRSDRQITVRVPRDKFDELVTAIEALGDVLHKNVAAEDVTDQYVDLSMRLKNATAVRDRLEKLLQTAQVRDAVEIHKELAKVTEEIERLQGKLKLLGDRIAYSTVTVSFEKNQQQAVRSQALLPFPWMNTMGLGPLLRVPR